MERERQRVAEREEGDFTGRLQLGLDWCKYNLLLRVALSKFGENIKLKM